jgi:hypothetical protein
MGNVQQVFSLLKINVMASIPLTLHVFLAQTPVMQDNLKIHSIVQQQQLTLTDQRFLMRMDLILLMQHLTGVNPVLPFVTKGFMLICRFVQQDLNPIQDISQIIALHVPQHAKQGNILILTNVWDMETLMIDVNNALHLAVVLMAFITTQVSHCAMVLVTTKLIPVLLVRRWNSVL